jgi:hypothetical protein
MVLGWSLNELLVLNREDMSNGLENFPVEIAFLARRMTT